MKLLREAVLLIRIVALSIGVILKCLAELKVLFNGIGIVEVRIAVRTAYVRDMDSTSALS